MKKIKKIASIAMATVMLLSAVPMTASAAAAKAVDSENVAKGIKLSWSKTSSAKNYTVYRSTKKNSGFKSVGTTSKVTFTDNKTSAGKTYYYKVKASTGATYKVEKAVRLTAPKLKSVKAKKNSNLVTVKWEAVKGAKKYYIYRAKVVNGKTKTFQAWGSTKKTKYNDYLETGTYKYKIKAVSGDCFGVDSNIKTINYVESTAPITTPNEMHTLMSVYFFPVDGVDGYKIYRSTNSSDFELVYNVKAKDLRMAEKGSTYEGLAVYEDAQVEYGNTYQYGIKTYKDNKNSLMSEGVETEFNEGDVVVEIGETSDELKEGIQAIKDLLESFLGEELASQIQMDFSVTVEDERIATVDEDLVVTGHAIGKTFATMTITATFEGETQTVDVPEKLLITVTEADAMLQLGGVTTSNAIIDAVDFIKGFIGEEYADQLTITYETEDDTVATVGEDGTIIAVGAGKTNVYFIISYTDENGETVTQKSDAISVYVDDATANPDEPSEDPTTPDEVPSDPAPATDPSEPTSSETTPSDPATDPSEEATDPSEVPTTSVEDTTDPSEESIAPTENDDLAPAE